MYPKIIRISIFISEDVIKKELNGLIIKRTISTIDTKEHRHTFLVTSVEESISILYTFRKRYSKIQIYLYILLEKDIAKYKYTYIYLYILMYIHQKLKILCLIIKKRDKSILYTTPILTNSNN